MSGQASPDFIKAFEKSILIVGGFLGLMGLIGIIAPHVVAITTTVFLGVIMIAAGLFFGYYTYQFHTRSFVGWLKPIILTTVGVMMLMNPQAGIAALTLMVTLYLFMDSYAGFGLAYMRHPEPGWGWFFINGLLSLLLAILMLIGWPAMSAVFLGLYIGISLLLDGISLFMFGMKLKSMEEQLEAGSEA